MNVQIYDAHPTPASLHQEVLRGLQSSPKAIAPKFFYDARGSQLFDAICETPEYYPTRIEKQILRRYAGEISEIVGEGCLLIEPGSGSCQKVRLLLQDLKPSIYMPMEICHDHLLKAAQALVNEYDWLELSAVCADFTQLNKIPDMPDEPHRLAFFPGSTIGNFEPSQAVNFMRSIARLVGNQGGLLIGVDMKKPAKVLNAAYNDAQGLTADFN
ncbi:MAG: L-histidine N(alpha)-methyltransferase, partial [Gammaproteobacteria bacterium]|nr:L-histidine N(alpha)-methyltransferase [Gammaproteobacteria bacterium]